MYNKGGDSYKLGGRCPGPRRLSARPWRDCCPCSWWRNSPGGGGVVGLPRRVGLCRPPAYPVQRETALHGVFSVRNGFPATRRGAAGGSPWGLGGVRCALLLVVVGRGQGQPLKANNWRGVLALPSTLWVW